MKVDKKYLRSLIVEEIQALDEFNPFKAAADKVKGFFGKKSPAAPAKALPAAPAPSTQASPSAPAVSAEQKQMDGFAKALLQGAKPDQLEERVKDIVKRVEDIANAKMYPKSRIKGSPPPPPDYDYAINASKQLEASLKKLNVPEEIIYRAAGRLVSLSKRAAATKANLGKSAPPPPPPGSQPTPSTSSRKPPPPPPPPPPRSQKELEESVMEQFLNKVKGK